MTQPIQEPNLHRGLARSTWNENQLFRRPSPSSDAGGCDWAYMFWDEFATVPNETTDNITGYSLSAVVGSSIDPNEVTGEFEITVTGLYLLQAITQWANTFAGGKMAQISWTGGNVLQSTNYVQQWVSEQDLGTNVDTVTAEALIFVTVVSTAVEVNAAVRQTSGVGQDIAAVEFSIVRLCDLNDPVIS